MKMRVMLLLSCLLFVAGLGVALGGCGESREDAPPMPGVPEDPNYSKPASKGG